MGRFTSVLGDGILMQSTKDILCKELYHDNPGAQDIVQSSLTEFEAVYRLGKYFDSDDRRKELAAKRQKFARHNKALRKGTPHSRLMRAVRSG